MQRIDEQTKMKIQHRLHRVEGQVRGVQRMLDDGRECDELLQQLAAIRSAVHNTAILLARSYTESCLTDPDMTISPRKLTDRLLHLLDRVD